MKVRRILVGLFVLVATILVVGSVVLVNLDIEDYRETIQARVEAATGRTLAIAGPLDFELSLAPAITAENVSLGNATWGSRQEMMTVKQLELEIDLISILFGKFLFKRLILVEPDIVLETDDRGRGNWDFGEPRAADSGVAADLPEIHFEKVAISGGSASYRDARTGQTISVSIDRLEGRTEAGLRRLQLAFKGRYNGIPLAIGGELGSFAQFRTGYFPLDIEIKAAGAIIDVTGSLSDPLGTPNIELDIAGKGDDLAALGDLAGLKIPKLGPYEASLTLKGTGEVLDVRRLSMQAAGISAAGYITLSLERELPRIKALDLKVAMEGDNIAELGTLAGLELPALGPYDISLEVEGAEDAFTISGLAAQVAQFSASGGASLIVSGGRPKLENLDFAIAARGDRIAELGALAGVGLPPIGAYEASLKLAGTSEALEITDLEARVGRFSARGAATVLSGSQGPKLKNAELYLTARGEDVRELAALAEVDVPALGAYDIALELNLSGDAVKISDLKAKVGESNASGAANVSLANGDLAVTGLDLAIATRGESLADLGTRVGRELPALGAYTVSFKLKGGAKSFALSDIDAKAGESSIAGAVAVSLADNGPRIGDFDLQVATRGVPLPDLVGFLVAAPPGFGPVAFASRLERKGEVVKLTGITAKSGSSDIAGEAVVSLEGERPSIMGTFSAERLDLGDLGPLPEMANQPKLGQPAEERKTEARYLFTDEPLSFEALGAVDLDVELEAGTLRLDRETQLANVDIRAVLKDGHLGINPLRAEVYGGRLEAKLDLNAIQSPPSVGALVNLRGLDYGQLLKSRGITEKVTGKLDLDIEAQGTGNSLRAIASSLNGRLESVSDEGVIDDNLLRFLALGLNTIVGPLFGKADSGQLRCAVARFDIDQGLATSEAILAVMEDAAISGGGTIDLRTEGLDLAFQLETSKVNLSRFAGPFVVKGTLAQPNTGIDTLGTAFGVAKAAGMVFFPVTGLQLLASQMALETVAGENPCVAALARTPTGGDGEKGIVRSVTEGTVKAAKGATERATGAASDVVKGVTSGLKSLFAN